ncbi:MAG TPA: cytochrome c biogenesis protein CcsA [Verrucomicrobiae bacterium]|jgi:ABC-type transport system involved in cytochrome c biogenesis permease subunit|nr:cytochrome c biogenesis protein CcsA [Verrucomicrobiae bacterium]
MKKIFQKWFPAVLMLVMALWFFGQLQTPQDKNFAFNEFGKLPVVFDGRLKPLDSLARNSLLQIRQTQTLDIEPWKEWYQTQKIISADEWLANVMMNPQIADDWPVFRVDNPDLTTFLKLPEMNRTNSDGEHFSWNQIAPSLQAFDSENERVEKIEPAQRSVYERAVVKVHQRLELYVQLKNTIQPQNAENWKQELADYENLIQSGTAAVRAQQAGQNYDTNVFNAFLGELQRFDFMSKLETPLIVPPENNSGDWKRVGTVLLEAAKGEKISPAVQDYATMADAFKSGDVASFNSALADYRSLLIPDFSQAMAKSRAEVFFNQMQPFYNAMVIYVLAGLLSIFSWFNLSETLRRSAVWLIVLAFAIHTTGLIYRIVLQGRPPVTNLYSAAIFVGWGAVVLGLVLEKFHKNGIGAVVSAGIGFITLVIAQNLALDGDTMEMMRAVLDTNFWLATHVVVVTLGYASTFVAGFLGLIYIVRGVFTKTLDEATRKSLARMIYAIVCFATLFSFVGTVLGGIWADQSWGRFWGWDPKENGALIIVLWNALILHLRWGGMIRERGLAVCAVGGNIVTSWSFFGVNMLGIGLHSYGWTDATFWWLFGFVVSQIGFIVLGSLPSKMWKSFQPKT